MTVKELIEYFEKQDPNAEVFVDFGLCEQPINTIEDTTIIIGTRQENE